MSKTVTLRLSDEEYKQIASVAKLERRPISNFITHAVFNVLAEMFTCDDKEMNEIRSDKELAKHMRQGERDIREGKYKIVG